MGIFFALNASANDIYEEFYQLKHILRCDEHKNLNRAETHLCEMVDYGDQGYSYELVILDNLFSSYYKAILQNIPKSEHTAIKKIAKNARI